MLGLTITPIAFALAGISGGAFNPAVAFGLCAMHLTAWHNIWIYLIGEFTGALAAAAVFHFASPADRIVEVVARAKKSLRSVAGKVANKLSGNAKTYTKTYVRRGHAES